MLFLRSFTQYIKESMDLSGKKYKVTNTDDIKGFILAGKAIFTIESQTTGVWYTYKITQAKKNKDIYFVNVLRGPDNQSSYTYLGLVSKNGDSFRFGLTKNSKYKIDAPCTVAFDYFFKNLIRGVLHPKMNFYHMGFCGRCGRALTVPESIKRGLGPWCAGKMSEEEEINNDRRRKLTQMNKDWKFDEVKDKRKRDSRIN